MIKGVEQKGKYPIKTLAILEAIVTTKINIKVHITLLA
jgi:hypothetical protein